MKIHDIIIHTYNKFTKSEKKIGDYYLSNPTGAYAAKLSDIAELLNCGEATVLRFIKKCGYSSFKTFQYDLSNDLSETLKNDILDPKNTILSDYLFEINYLQQHIDINQIKEVAKLINEASFVGCMGITYSAQTAQFCSLDLRVSGVNACDFSAGNSMILISRQSPKNSVFLIFSRLGETDEIIHALSYANRDNITVIAICGKKDSRIAKLSDIVIDCSHSNTNYDLSTSTFITALNQILISRMIIKEYQNLDYNNRRKYVFDSHRSMMEIAK